MHALYPGKIELTSEEINLLKSIDFDLKSEDFDESADAMENLMQSLISRDAIPEIRWKYFTDPKLNIGLKKSKMMIFEENGTRGNDIFRHPHFLTYLKYFIYGPNLPKRVIDEFWKYIERGRYFSSGDVEELRKSTRLAVRQYGLDPLVACEEFHKLSLECDMTDDWARIIRNAARTVR